MDAPEAGRDVPERVEDLRAPPVPGRAYLVPTVRHGWLGVRGDWPVMGPRHEDPELGFPWRHHHVDLRFLTRRQSAAMTRSYGAVPQHPGDEVPARALAAAASPLRELPGRPLPHPVRRVRTCVADGHDYPLRHSLAAPRFPELHASHAGRRCGRDAAGRLVCPHRGFVLDGLAPDAAGRVTCPLHGLVVDVASGVVVPPPEVDSGVARWHEEARARAWHPREW